MSDTLAGTGLLDSAHSLARSLGDGDWIEAGLHGLSTGLGAAGAAVDPIATLTGMGVGWLIEHLGPLREMLEDVAGDPEAVMADAALLQDAARETGHLGLAVADASIRHLEDMRGEAVVACAAFGWAASEDVMALGALLDSGGTALRFAAGLVEGVRALVRDALADAVGFIASSAVTVVATGGTAAAAVVARVALKVESWVARLSGTMAALARSLEALRQLLLRAEALLDALAAAGRARRPVTVWPDADRGELFLGDLAGRLENASLPVLALKAGASGWATVAAGPEE